MRLRDPISSYKCFEAIATPSPIATMAASTTTTTATTHPHLNRATSLDSLANSSEADEGTTTTSSDDDDDDDDGRDDDCQDISDVDSISDFGAATSQSTTVSAQVHRRSDLEELSGDGGGIVGGELHASREPVVIKAYLEKSHRKCDYKNCGYKKGANGGGQTLMMAEVPVGRVGKEVQMREKEIRQHHVVAAAAADEDSDEIDESMMTPAAVVAATIAAATAAASATTTASASAAPTGQGTTGASSSASTNGSSSKTRRLSIASSGSVGRMETIVEEPPIESKISVKEILARFETLNSLEVRRD